MTDFLVKRFVKDYEDIEKVSVRTAYGVLASLWVLLVNIVRCWYYWFNDICSRYYYQHHSRLLTNNPNPALRSRTSWA